MGRFLKTAAVFYGAAITLFCIILGFYFMKTPEFLMYATIFILGGPVLALITAGALYCLGDTHEKVCEIKQMLGCGKKTIAPPPMTKIPSTAPAQNKFKGAPVDEDGYRVKKCPHCKEELYLMDGMGIEKCPHCGKTL